MYEKTFHANGRLSEWNAAPMIVPREGQDVPLLVFDYHWVYEDQPGNWMHNQEREYRGVSRQGDTRSICGLTPSYSCRLGGTRHLKVAAVYASNIQVPRAKQDISESDDLS